VYHCFLSYCPTVRSRASLVRNVNRLHLIVCSRKVIDTGTSIIVGPPYILDPVIKAIGPVKSDCSNLNSLPTIAFNLGGVTGGAVLPLEPTYYVLKEETSPGVFECELGMCVCVCFFFFAVRSSASVFESDCLCFTHVRHRNVFGRGALAYSWRQFSAPLLHSI
jgi:hypothetical protein